METNSCEHQAVGDVTKCLVSIRRMSSVDAGLVIYILRKEDEAEQFLGDQIRSQGMRAVSRLHMSLK